MAHGGSGTGCLHCEMALEAFEGQGLSRPGATAHVCGRVGTAVMCAGGWALELVQQRFFTFGTKYRQTVVIHMVVTRLRACRFLLWLC